MAITKEQLRETLKPIIETEYDDEVIVLKQTDDTKITVALDMFILLFEDADLTFNSLTQDIYKPYRYEQYFKEWKELGYIL